MPSSKPPVEIKASGSAPLITIIMGKAQGGSYRIRMKPPNSAATVWEGDSDDDNLTDTHPLGPIAGLDGNLLSWRILMSSSSDSPGQIYMATVIITQDGIPVTNGVYQYPIRDPYDIVRLKVVP